MKEDVYQLLDDLSGRLVDIEQEEYELHKEKKSIQNLLVDELAKRLHHVKGTELREIIKEIYWFNRYMSEVADRVFDRLTGIGWKSGCFYHVSDIPCHQCGKGVVVSSWTDYERTKHYEKDQKLLCTSCLIAQYENRPDREREKHWARLRELRAMPYNDYLLTPEWRATRLAALERASYCCCKCGNTELLQVHHLSYANLGEEEPRDLMVLCKSCHERVHGRKFGS